ncbi:MAG: hypothetical protein AAGG53_07730 [Cyanobacteria bacterium P01_H01_bin.152]
MPKRYLVRLSEAEQEYPKDLVSTGTSAAYKIKQAHILLSIDVNGGGWTDEPAAQAFSCHGNTVANLRQRLMEQGFEAALQRKLRPTPPRPPVCDGPAEAYPAGAPLRRTASRVCPLDAAVAG